MKTRHFSWRAACTCLSVATTFVLKMEIRRQKEKALGSFTAAETKKSDRFRVAQFFSCGCADGAWTVRSRVSGCERVESGTGRLRADIWRTCHGRVANASGGYRRCGAKQAIVIGREYLRACCRRGLVNGASDDSDDIWSAVFDRGVGTISSANGCGDYTGDGWSGQVRPAIW